MNAIQLLVRSVLYRKSQRKLAEELFIPKATLNRALKGGGSLSNIKTDSLNDAYCHYPMPEGFSPEASIKVEIPSCLSNERGFIMETVNTAVQGTPLETNFRMQEIRELILEGADYSDGSISLNEATFKLAKTKLDEFERFKKGQGSIAAKYEFWVKHTQEAIKIFETAYSNDFKTDTAVLKSSLELVFDLKKAIDYRQLDNAQKHVLEFLLITSATQTAEILFEGGYAEIIPDISNIIADTFGKYAEASFKLLMVAAAWSHNQEGMKKQAELGKFNSNDLSLKGSKLEQRKEKALELMTPLNA